MVSRLAIASTAAILLSSSVAGLKVIDPNSDRGWVAESSNVLSWTCYDSVYEKFTVLITNNNVNILTIRAIIGNQTNSDCYKTITQDQVNLPVERGYVILLANPINNAEIYATSEEFGIQPISLVGPTAAITPDLPKPTSSSSSPASIFSSSWQDRWEDWFAFGEWGLTQDL